MALGTKSLYLIARIMYPLVYFYYNREEKILERLSSGIAAS